MEFPLEILKKVKEGLEGYVEKFTDVLDPGSLKNHREQLNEIAAAMDLLEESGRHMKKQTS